MESNKPIKNQTFSAIPSPKHLTHVNMHWGRAGIQMRDNMHDHLDFLNLNFNVK